jgi:8-oxo-dGTP diphosphatase
VAVVVRDSRFLVIRRSLHVRAPGTLCFPGGHIEPQESESDALVREFREELSAEIRPVRCVWRSTTRWQVELSWWLADLPEGTHLLPNPAEVAEVHWLTAQEMLGQEHLLESNRAFLAGIASGQIVLE